MLSFFAPRAGQFDRAIQRAGKPAMLLQGKSLIPRAMPGRPGAMMLRKPDAAGKSIPGADALSCAGATALTAGSTVSDTTVGGTNNQSTYGCFSSSYQWNGPEKVYTFTTSQTSDIRITLQNISGGDVDLFILGSCDATDCWNWGDERVFYPDAPAGTYYIVVDGWNTDSASYDITAWSCTGILLVDDDHSGWPGNLTGYPDVSSTYQAALTAIGKPATYTWNVDYLGSPALSNLMPYKQVIWVTGQDDRAGAVISSNEEGTLAGYLDGGGELILVSQNYLRDISGGTDGPLDEGTFAFQYLQVQSVVNDLTGHTASMVGVNGDPIGDDGNLGTGTNTLTLSSTTPVANNPTGMDTLYAKMCYRTDNGIPTVLRWDNYNVGDFYRLVFATSPVENTTSSSPNDLDTFLDRSLAWMDQYYYPDISSGATFVDGSTANGLPDPGETIGLNFIVQDNETKGYSAEAYLVIHDSYVTPVTDKVDIGAIPDASCDPDTNPGCNQASGQFSVTISPTTPIGHRIEFSVNLWIDGIWYDTPGFGFFVGQADTMLVKDEELYPNTSGIAPYENALDGMGVTYAVHDNAKFASPRYDDASLMTNLIMKNYAHVVWMTGQDWAYTLSPYDSDTNNDSDERELGNLLDNGGRLFLVSQDYFYDLFGGDSCSPSCTLSSGDFAYDYLGIGTVNQDVVDKADSTITGNSGEDLGNGMSFTLKNDQYIPNLPDAATAFSPLPGRDIFELPGSQVSGIAYEGDSAYSGSDYRVITFLFPFENLQSILPSTREGLMERIYYWFDFGDTHTNSLGDSFTYYYPEDTTLSVTLGGSDASELSWTSVSTNTHADTIDIHYHLYSGTNPSSLAKDPLDYTGTTAEDATVPSSGQCLFYRVRACDTLQIESEDP